MRHPLTDTYRNGREQLLELGRSLMPSEGDIMTTACPAWSVKDVFAHLAGISTDIMTGNTEGAATEAWADGHVAARVDRSLADVLDEWSTAGPEVSNVMEEAGEAFPFQLFVDQWTHEWDIRAALGAQASAESDDSVFTHFLSEFDAVMSADGAEQGLDRLTLEIDGQRLEVGTGAHLGEVSLTTFEFARISMGRRSRRQLMELDWPDGDMSAHIDVLVRWSVAEFDVHDPIILTS